MPHADALSDAARRQIRATEKKQTTINTLNILFEMKKFMKLSVVLVAGALAFSSCNCFKKMAKNRDEVNLTVNPEILTLNNGFVAADINVTFPEAYFNNKAVVKVTPVIVFEGGEVAGTPKFYQGSKVDDNYTVVENNGGSFTQHVEFPYDARMDQCALQLRAEIKCPSGACKEFTLVNLNDGAIPTKEQAEILAGDDEAAKAALAKEFGLTVAYGLNTLQKDIKYGDIMEPMANNYKRVTTVVDKTDLLYAINSSVVTKKNERKADLNAFKSNVDKNLENDRATQNIAIKGYASPDGPEKFNDKLSKARSESGKKVVPVVFPQGLIAEVKVAADGQGQGLGEDVGGVCGGGGVVIFREGDELDIVHGRDGAVGLVGVVSGPEGSRQADCQHRTYCRQRGGSDLPGAGGIRGLVGGFQFGVDL